ncbi:MAG: polymerase III, delta subunit protein [Parcubacteria group bacterium GW2011_GWA2_47_10]|nr:MAG: polymerase III, delta subunit protein [Parcubacteria group bacterium GW2011_GWA2_47_10]
MIYMLYGPDTYRSRKKMRQIIDELQKKHGGNLALEKFDADEDGASRVMSATDTASLFQEKKLVVIERLLSSKKSGLIALLLPKFEEWGKSKTDFFILWDEDIAEKKGTSELLKHALKSQEFAPLSREQARSFIAAKAKTLGVRMSPKEEVLLLARHKNNLWGIVRELEKISLGGTLAEASVLNTDEEIYTFLDALILKQKTAPRLLFSLFERGLEEIYVFAAIINAYRLLLLAKVYADDSETISRIPKELALHPFVFKKAREQSKKFDLAVLRSIYKKLPAFDSALKLRKMKLEEIVFELLNTPYRAASSKK